MDNKEESVLATGNRSAYLVFTLPRPLTACWATLGSAGLAQSVRLPLPLHTYIHSHPILCTPFPFTRHVASRRASSPPPPSACARPPPSVGRNVGCRACYVARTVGRTAATATVAITTTQIDNHKGIGNLNSASSQHPWIFPSGGGLTQKDL